MYEFDLGWYWAELFHSEGNHLNCREKCCSCKCDKGFLCPLDPWIHLFITSCPYFLFLELPPLFPNHTTLHISTTVCAFCLLSSSSLLLTPSLPSQPLALCLTSLCIPFSFPSPFLSWSNSMCTIGCRGNMRPHERVDEQKTQRPLSTEREEKSDFIFRQGGLLCVERWGGGGGGWRGGGGVVDR